MIKQLRNNNVPCRNFAESQDLHDVCKVLLLRMLRRKHPDSNKVAIYSEYFPDFENKLYPDIYLDLGKDEKYVFEIQDKWSKDWEMKQSEAYDGYANLVVIKLKEVPSCIKEIKKYLEGFLL